MLLVAVLSTAAFVHFTWQRTASENVERIVSRLDAQRASTVCADLSATFAVLASTAEIVRSILFQGTIKADDEVKREFLFLSLLRSQPAVSRLSFGWPDGRYFGAEKVGYDRIRMIEVRDGQLRIDEYEALLTDNPLFRERTIGVGLLAAEDALALGVSGPLLRASGVAHDLRKARPYCGYEKFQFRVCTASAGDCLMSVSINVPSGLG